MLLENLVGSTTKVKILRLFCEYPNRTFTTNEVIQNTGMGAGYGLKCLNMFAGIGILSKTKVGREKRYKLDTKNELYPALNELFSKERQNYPNVSYLHRGLIADISEKLNEETVLIFGSVAAGTATSDSDVDLLIISQRPEYVKKALRMIGLKTGIKLQLVIFSPEKLQEYAKTNNRLLKNISKEHIFVRGDEKTRRVIESV
jgi:predicted nucleotidyltransferase